MPAGRTESARQGGCQAKHISLHKNISGNYAMRGDGLFWAGGCSEEEVKEKEEEGWEERGRGGRE